MKEKSLLWLKELAADLDIFAQMTLGDTRVALSSGEFRFNQGRFEVGGEASSGRKVLCLKVAQEDRSRPEIAPLRCASCNPCRLGLLPGAWHPHSAGVDSLGDITAHHSGERSCKKQIVWPGNSFFLLCFGEVGFSSFIRSRRLWWVCGWKLQGGPASLLPKELHQSL